ncbi:MAG: hypothetical protein M0C28_31345 [Candidatus Moduliflexus flocculans]|nr:hypothetical protein [Candidatus Moduliflexus flocculans]
MPMDGVAETSVTANGYFKKEELAWLDNQLSQHQNSKAIIVQHFPIYEPFKSKTHFIHNADEYKEILSKHNNVIAVLSGHYHSAQKIQKNRKHFLHTELPRSVVEYPQRFQGYNS